MKLPRTIMIVIACGAAVGIGFAALFMRALSAKPQPLESSSGDGSANGDAKSALPKDTFILSIAEGAEVAAPFILRENAAAVGGIALVLPKGTRTDEHKGKARLTLNSQTAGSYNAWARGLWRDTCSNSFSLKSGEAPEQVVGNDDVFGVWHWVPAGKHNLIAGKNTITITEREDGIEIDQVLFTRDPGFQPTGPVSPIGCARGIRRFADTFNRSPDHGNDGWDMLSGDWHIAFSFDPNRIPNQYALEGKPTQGEAMALVQGAPWYGCRLSFSFSPSQDGKYGAVLDRSLDGKSALLAAFEISKGHASLSVEGAGSASAPLDISAWMRLNQWHRVVIERWAWVLRISVDDRPVLTRVDLAPRAGKVGFFVSAGSAAFDDLELEEIPWQADDGKELTLPWTLGKDAKWFRPTASEKGQALIGRGGSIGCGLGGMPVEEIFIDETNEKGAPVCTVHAAGVEPENAIGTARFLKRPRFVSKAAVAENQISEADSASATFQVQGEEETHIRRVAVRYGVRTPDRYFIGPYHFANTELVDPSDYLDFTPAEYEAMAKSPEAAKLRRVPKIKTILGRDGDDESPWVRESGMWGIRDGVLYGQGPNAHLRHAQEVAGDMELTLKLKLLDAHSSAEIVLYGGPDPALRIAFFPLPAMETNVKSAAKIASKQTFAAELSLCVPADGNWHDVSIHVQHNTVEARVDKAASERKEFVRGDGSRIHFNVLSGAAEFNDIQFVIPRHTPEGFFYPFDRAETDWWRESQGGARWLDHGGIACVLASSWVALSAAQGGAEGVLRNKHSFGPNLAVAFDVEENSEWFGWDKQPNHLHYPYDNITVWLTPEKTPERGYKLLLNAENRSATILYRDGKEVTRVSQQTNFFPMQYVGGHGPYFPRRNRISLIKHEGHIRAVLNGKEILHFDDADPLDVSQVALGGHQTHINFTDIEVRQFVK